MKFEHRGETIELFLVGIHHPNYPDIIWEKAKAKWIVIVNEIEYASTRIGNREEVLAAEKAFIDWLIDDPDLT